MTRMPRRTHLLSTAFGLVMAAAAGIQTTGSASVVAMLAAVAVLAGIRFRVAATLAVLLAAAALVLTDAAPLVAGLAGLSAACYLVERHAAVGRAALMGASSPTTVAALGFTLVGVVAASFPFELPWVPLLAPPAVFAIYVLATRRFFHADDGQSESR
jgi:hypothetical protein